MPSSTKAAEKKPPKDYLREFKTRREQESQYATKKNPKQEWERVMNDPGLSDAEKFKIIKLKTE